MVVNNEGLNAGDMPLLRVYWERLQMDEILTPRKKQPFRVLSWGCGVQSTLLGELSARGELPPLDMIVHADLGWERQKTYDIRDFYTARWRKMGLRVDILQTGNIQAQGSEEYVHIPFFTETGAPLRRQCTRYFKIRPIKRHSREAVGFHPSKAPAPPPGAIESWIGFTVDEWTRARKSEVAYIVNRWPFLEPEYRRSRQDCTQWFEDHPELPAPIKSACVCCPFRRPSEWMAMRDEAPDEWAAAIAFDERNRNNPWAKREGQGTADELYIYRYDCTPLGEADLEFDAEREKRLHGTQLPMFGCGTGFCGT